MQALCFCPARNNARNKHATEHGQTPPHCGPAAKRAAIYEPSPSVANPVFMVTHGKQVTEVIFSFHSSESLATQAFQPSYESNF